MNFDLSELASVLGRKSRRKSTPVFRYSPSNNKSKTKLASINKKLNKNSNRISNQKIYTKRPLTTITEYAKKNKMTKQEEIELSKLFENITAKGIKHRSKKHRSKKHRSKRHRSKRHRSKSHRSKRHRSKRHRSKRHHLKRHSLKRHSLKRHRSKKHHSKKHRSKRH